MPGMLETITKGVVTFIVGPEVMAITVALVQAPKVYQVGTLAGSILPKPITIPVIDAVKLVPLPVTTVAVTVATFPVSTTSCMGLATPIGKGPIYLSVAFEPVFCTIKVPMLVLVASYEVIGVVVPVNLCLTALSDIF